MEIKKRRGMDNTRGRRKNISEIRVGEERIRGGRGGKDRERRRIMTGGERIGNERKKIS